MINDTIIFFSEYYMYLTAFSFPRCLKSKETERIFEVRYQDIILKYILQKDLNKNLENFLRKA